MAEKYGYAYPAPPGYGRFGGYYGPPVMAPPNYTGFPGPRREPGFIETCLGLLCCCCLLDACCMPCCDPIFLM